MESVHPAVIFQRLEPQPSENQPAQQHLADVLHRRQRVVILAQRVVSMRIGCNNPGDAAVNDIFRVGVLQVLVEHLFPEASGLVAAVFFLGAENTEILSGCGQQLGRSPGDLLHAVVKGGNTVDEIERFGGLLAVEHLHRAATGKRLFGCPVGPLSFHFSPGIAPFLKRLQWFLQRLGNIAVVHQRPADIDDFIDIFDHHRALFFTRPAGGARPDLVFLQHLVYQLFVISGGRCQQRVLAVDVIAAFDGDKAR